MQIAFSSNSDSDPLLVLLAHDLSYILEDTSMNIDLSGTDSDGDSLRYYILELPTDGSLIDVSSGLYVNQNNYELSSNQVKYIAGTTDATFSYYVKDATLSSDRP